MYQVYFHQQVLTKYEEACGFEVKDDGSVRRDLGAGAPKVCGQLPHNETDYLCWEDLDLPPIETQERER